MFTDVGKKIKTVVRYLTIILSVLLPVLGLIFVSVGDDLDVLGWIMIPSPLLLLIPAMFAYGFGELVDTAIYLREGQAPPAKKVIVPPEKKKQPKEHKTAPAPAVQIVTTPAEPAIDATSYIGKKICSGCGKLLPAETTICPHCESKYLGVITRSNAANIVANLKDGFSANC